MTAIADILRASRRELGRIDRASLDADHPGFVAVRWRGPGLEQALSCGLTSEDEARAFLRDIAQGLDLNGDVERLVGLEVYALRAFGTNNDPIVGFENAATGARFVARAWWNARHPENPQRDPRAKRIEEVGREIAWLSRRLREEEAKYLALHDETCVDWAIAPPGPEPAGAVSP